MFSVGTSKGEDTAGLEPEGGEESTGAGESDHVGAAGLEPEGEELG